jgi:hypothetical protein
VSNQPQGQIGVRYLLWLTTQNPIQRTGFVSQWAGASAQEANALVAGTTVEVSRFMQFPATLTKAQIQAFLQQDFVCQQAAFAAATQPGAFFGGFMDSVGWSF